MSTESTEYDAGAEHTEEQGGQTLEDIEELESLESDEFDSDFASFAKGEDPPETGEKIDSLEKIAGEGDERPEEQNPTEDQLDAVFEGVSDKQRKAILNLKADNARIRSQERSASGRIGSFQRRINELEAENRQLRAGTGSAPGKGGQQPGQQGQNVFSGDEWDDFSHDYPHMAKILQQQSEIIQRQSAQLEPLAHEAQTRKQTEQETFISEQEAALVAAYPDYEQVYLSDVFQSWLSEQTSFEQAKVNSPHASDAIGLMDRFHKETGKSTGDTTADHGSVEDKGHATTVKEHRQRQRASGRGVKTRETGQRLDQGGEDFETLFDRFATKQK